MNSNTKTFQTILLIILFIGLAVGLMIFGGVINPPSRGSNQIQASGTVTMWGPFPSSQFSDFISFFNDNNENINLIYRSKPKESYDVELLEAFASGTAPDIILLPHTLIQRYADKVVLLNEDTLPQRSFQDLYSQGASVFRIPAGTVGLPVGVDPLVMYYNRDLLEASGFINPPEFWNDDFLTTVQAISDVETDGLDLATSAVALGVSSNIPHAVEIFSTLAMQLGNPMVGFENGRPVSVLRESSPFVNNPTEVALEYFTQFANPSSDVYSWNSSMMTARDSFAAEETAIYFGFASELLEIQRKNPNLNFDVTAIPQIKDINRELTYGDFYSLAISRTSMNPEAAFGVAGALSTGPYNVGILTSANLQPVRRDILVGDPTNPYQQIFFDAAIIARAWLNPNPVTVDAIFSNVTSSVNSGQLNLNRAINQFNQRLDELF